MPRTQNSFLQPRSSGSIKPLNNENVKAVQEFTHLGSNIT